MSQILLFGAGASYGSDTRGTPPLGVGLFAELQRFNPDGWGRISGDLAARFKLNFEDSIKLISSHALPPLQRAMAAYFFEFHPQPSNLYIELSRRIQRSGWSGTVCSLNYDRLLELSLLQTGIQPFVGDPPPGGGGVELCIPHGCCHIFCDSVRGAARGYRSTHSEFRPMGPYPSLLIQSSIGLAYFKMHSLL